MKPVFQVHSNGENYFAAAVLERTNAPAKLRWQINSSDEMVLTHVDEKDWTVRTFIKFKDILAMRSAESMVAELKRFGVKLSVDDARTLICDYIDRVPGMRHPYINRPTKDIVAAAQTALRRLVTLAA